MGTTGWEDVGKRCLTNLMQHLGLAFGDENADHMKESTSVLYSAGPEDFAQNKEPIHQFSGIQ